MLVLVGPEQNVHPTPVGIFVVHRFCVGDSLSKCSVSRKKVIIFNALNNVLKNCVKSTHVDNTSLSCLLEQVKSTQQFTFIWAVSILILNSDNGCSNVYFCKFHHSP